MAHLAGGTKVSPQKLKSFFYLDSLHSSLKYKIRAKHTMTLPSELADKIPYYLVANIRSFLCNSVVADMVKNVAFLDHHINKNIKIRVLISNLPRQAYPSAGFEQQQQQPSSFYYCLPSIKWTQKQLYMLAVGLLPNVRKSWCKRQLLQALYPNLQFL